MKPQHHIEGGQGRRAPEIAATVGAVGIILAVGIVLGIVLATPFPKLALVGLLGLVVWGVSRDSK